jgi:hypothetical protein
VCEAGGERAEGDEGLALPRRRFNGASGVVHPPDEVSGEREPGVGPLTQRLGWHPEHPAGGHSSTGREINAVLVPRAEPAGPAARCVHPRDHGVLAADVTPELDGPVHEHPPVVRVLALMEQVDPGLDTHLGAGFDQLRKLLVGQTVEEAERSEVVDVHQVVAR